MTGDQFVELFKKNADSDDLQEQIYTDGEISNVYLELPKNIYLEISLTVHSEYATMAGGTDEYGNQEYYKELVGRSVHISEIRVYQDLEEVAISEAQKQELEEIIEKSI